MIKTRMLRIPDELPARYEVMPPHLGGYWWVTEHLICIPFVETDKHGAFKTFMRKLERQNKIIFFPTIISARLQDICERNGYVTAYVIDKDMGFVSGMAKFPEPIKKHVSPFLDIDSMSSYTYSDGTPYP